jgi:hypothetical protein
MDRRLFLTSAGAMAAVGGTGAAAGPNPFVVTTVVLYLPDRALRERGPPPEALADYIKSLEARANAVLAALPGGRGVSGAVVVGLKPPARSRIWVMAGEKSREAELTAALKAPLESVSPPAVQGFNAFALNFDAWGGGSALFPSSSPPVPVPEEWRRALPHGGILPDAVFRAIWPD